MIRWLTVSVYLLLAVEDGCGGNHLPGTASHRHLRGAWHFLSNTMRQGWRVMATNTHIHTIGFYHLVPVRNSRESFLYYEKALIKSLCDCLQMLFHYCAASEGTSEFKIPLKEDFGKQQKRLRKVYETAPTVSSSEAHAIWRRWKRNVIFELVSSAVNMKDTWMVMVLVCACVCLQRGGCVSGAGTYSMLEKYYLPWCTASFKTQLWYYT